MASPIGLLYGSNAQAITCTCASLANTGARQGTAIANTGTIPFEDLLVQFACTSASSGVSATGVVNIYAVASVDGGSTYGESATGSDAAITLTVPTNAKLIGQMNVVATSKAYKSNPFSVAQAFGGFLPQYVVIIIQNLSGAALAATATLTQYQGVEHQA